MNRPPRRPDVPPRRSDNEKRRLHPDPSLGVRLTVLLLSATYHGISKHKADPVRFGLPYYKGRRGDESLCDDHANFAADFETALDGFIRRGADDGRSVCSDQEALVAQFRALQFQRASYSARVATLR